jgi:hypothetical protein
MFQCSESSPSSSTSVSCYLGATQGDQRQVVIPNLVTSLERTRAVQNTPPIISCVVHRLTIIIAARSFNAVVQSGSISIASTSNPTSVDTTGYHPRKWIAQEIIRVVIFVVIVVVFVVPRTLTTQATPSRTSTPKFGHEIIRVVIFVVIVVVFVVPRTLTTQATPSRTSTPKFGHEIIRVVIFVVIVVVFVEPRTPTTHANPSSTSTLKFGHGRCTTASRLPRLRMRAYLRRGRLHA